MQIDSGRFRLTPSTSGQFNARLPVNLRRRGLTLAVALALGGTLALGLSPAAVAQGFPATFPLSSLNGTNGFKLDSASEGNLAGGRVSGAGDINGDGLDDVIVSAPRADPNGNDSGSSYIVFGQTTPFAATLALGSLNGTGGFRMDGAAAFDEAGRRVSGAGDFNSDGFDDVIISAPRADPNGMRSAGSSYVVFGRGSPFSATLELGSLNGTDGVRIDGATSYDGSGSSVSDAGDVNGDGIDDVIVGYYERALNGSYSGGSYVVFGRSTSFAPTLALSALDGSNGFHLDGEDSTGRAVSSAGDVNGDGIDDVIVGAYRAEPNGVYSGSSYVVFGHNAPFASTLALSSLDGSNGFRLDGVGGSYSGRSVSGIGDFNGDGFDDVMVGAPGPVSDGTLTSGSVYVIYGQNVPFAAVKPLSSLDGTNGFRLDGMPQDRIGFSLRGAGHVNGDGLDDLIFSAIFADRNGEDSGSTYVVFGQRTPTAAVLSVSSLNGNNGFRLDGSVGERSGYSVSAAGDVNGDGVDDLIIGTLYAEPNSTVSGSSYVVFGRDAVFADGFE